MQRHLRRLTVATIALTLLIVPLASVSIADRLDAKADVITPNAKTVFRGLGINKMAAVTNDGAFSTTSESYDLMPGNTVYVDITKRSVLLMTFSAESQCSHTDAGSGGYCVVEIWVDNVNEAYPQQDNFAFGDADVEGYQAHSMQRAIGPLNPGSYQVQVWWFNSDPNMNHTIGYSTLTVQAITQAG